VLLGIGEKLLGKSVCCCLVHVAKILLFEGRFADFVEELLAMIVLFALSAVPARRLQFLEIGLGHWL
jgi:hypothetical protein